MRPPPDPQDLKDEEARGRRRGRSPLGRLIRDWLWPLPPPPAERQFFPFSLQELRGALRTSDKDLAAALLSEAEDLFGEVEARIESVERRATALQGSVAIATAVAVAGAGLALDNEAIRSQAWRTGLLAGVGLFVVCLIVAALLATAATSRILAFKTVSDNDLARRAEGTHARALSDRAAYKLYAYSVNNELARIKTRYLRRAGVPFAAALIVLLMLVATLVAYAAVDTSGERPARAAAAATQLPLERANPDR